MSKEFRDTSFHFEANDYFGLLAAIAPLDRCHNSAEMEQAYGLLFKHYKGSRLLKYELSETVNHWRLPPRWNCEFAELRDQNGNLIASRNNKCLEVYSYSPSIDQWVSYEELVAHLLTDSNRPESVIFHFRNQYRHWNPEWGFSIPYSVFMNSANS